MKRHGYGGVGESTHGQHRLRAPGSIGAASTPHAFLKGSEWLGKQEVIELK